MSCYRHHAFFCVNERTDGSQCCANYGAHKARDHTKTQCKKLGIHSLGQVRVCVSSCLGRCSEGPILVIYPEAIWYSYVDLEDIDEIINQHLLRGNPVQRLMLESRY